MKCPQCGNEAQDNGRYCAFCGAEVHSDPRPVNKPLMPLAQGSVSKSSMEQWRETARKKLKTVDIILSIFLGMPFILFLIGAFGEKNTELYKYAMWATENWWAMAIPVALLLWSEWMVRREWREIEETASYFLDQCERESLVIDAEKIYGSTFHGSFTVNRDKIRSVECEARCYVIRDKGIDDFAYQSLTIYDTQKRSFKFITFSNAKELCAIIQSICAKYN